MDREIEGLILNWPDFKQTTSSRDNCWSAELALHGLRITLHCDAPEFAVVEQMATLGQHLMTASLQTNPVTSDWNNRGRTTVVFKTLKKNGGLSLNTLEYTGGSENQTQSLITSHRNFVRLF